jgi:hypothetical protein
MNIYIEEIRKVLRQEEIDFRLVGKLLELAVGELYRELLLLLDGEIERERQKREKGKAQSQEEKTYSRGKPSMRALCPCGKTSREKRHHTENDPEGVL